MCAIFAGAIDIVACIGIELDRVVGSEIVVRDEAWDSARHSAVFAGCGRLYCGG